MNEMDERPSLSSVDELCVFLMNRIGICVSASEAATTQELVNKVIETWFTPRLSSSSSPRSSLSSSSPTDSALKNNSTLPDLRYSTNGPDDLIKFFTLWITSPTLELQLKPLHRPFKVLKHWENLSNKYGFIKENFVHLYGSSSASSTSVNLDPIVSFQRNIFTAKWEEMKTTDPDVLQLLYEEAKVNVLDGRYPVDSFEKLAAIQAAIELGPFNPKLHSSKFLKQMIGQLFGSVSHHRSSSTSSVKWSTSLTSPFTQSSSSLENKIIHYYRKLGNVTSKTQLYRNYLQMCWPLPYYGSAYFHGLIERSSKNFVSLISNRLIQVWIAINPIGVHIIDEKHSRLIISLEFKRFKWELALTSNSQSKRETQVPSIFFYFWSRVDYKTNLIQVISPQAYLMNTLLNAFHEKQSGHLSRRQIYSNDNDFNYANFDQQPTSIQTSNQKTSQTCNYKGNRKYRS
ncbi:putative FERM domain-containing protein FRMD8P1 [Tetranychus urticae]|uniref:FERM domain-containing protein 8 n=1 Tax=Tetranychus urticae TaxID=32264 RepID=T1L3T7_TETUR|nr:putative FERM domain-containing protein FRMD8P1 [Tetranychus urticae]